jgi:hypothetical protein
LNGTVANNISAALQDLAASGQPPAGIACTLELLAMEYEGRPSIEDMIDLVTTGGEENCGILWFPSRKLRSD